jgi:hypothetical protein
MAHTELQIETADGRCPTHDEAATAKHWRTLLALFGDSFGTDRH